MEDREDEQERGDPVDKLLSLIQSYAHLDMASLDAMLEEFEAKNWTEEN